MATSLLQKWLTFLSITLIVSGGTYLILAHRNVSAMRQSFAPLQANVSPGDSSTPQMVVEGVSRLTLTDIGMSLPVIDGTYDSANQTWSLDDEHAFFMKGSATPVIYGHAIPPVFGPLAGVKAHTLLKIETSRGIMSFRYVGDEFVDPDDTHILNRYISNTVLLMTCDGLFSEQRRVLHFEYTPEGYSQ